MGEIRERKGVVSGWRGMVGGVLQDGLCAFTLKSQSHIVLFLKRKSEGLAEALP